MENLAKKITNVAMATLFLTIATVSYNTKNDRMYLPEGQVSDYKVRIDDKKNKIVGALNSRTVTLFDVEGKSLEFTYIGRDNHHLNTIKVYDTTTPKGVSYLQENYFGFDKNEQVQSFDLTSYEGNSLFKSHAEDLDNVNNYYNMVKDHFD